MEHEVKQLVEMGATAAQARAALKKHKDVMQAAERIFDGQFDDVEEDEPASTAASAGPSTSRAAGKIPVSRSACTRVGRVDLSGCRPRSPMRTTTTSPWKTTTEVSLCRMVG
jgi:hypothetical protein